MGKHVGLTLGELSRTRDGYKALDVLNEALLCLAGRPAGPGAPSYADVGALGFGEITVPRPER